MHLATYESSNRQRIALSAWGVMFSELVEYWSLVKRLVYRNLAGQFRQSFLGYIWIALPPIATAVVFTLLRGAGVMSVDLGPGAMPYALFAMLGATLWGFFSQVILMATASVFGAGTLVSKIYFPREVLVFSGVGNAVVNLAVRLLVVALTFVMLGYAPHWQVVFAPVLLVPILLLSVGLGLIFAPIHTMMNDTARILEFLLQFGMLLAPTVYRTPVLAEADTTGQRMLYWLHTFNPVTHFMQAFNRLIEEGTFGWDLGLTVATICCLLVFFLGWRFFHICEPLLAERM